MKIYSKQKNRAFTLIETLVAISIFSMSILGLMTVLAQGISDTGYAKKKMVATYLAQEGIEYARNLRDNAVLFGAGWSDYNVVGTIDDSSIDDPDLSSFFERTITKNKISDDEASITSIVTWAQSSGRGSITFSENLFNWVE